MNDEIVLKVYPIREDGSDWQELFQCDVTTALAPIIQAVRARVLEELKQSEHEKLPSNDRNDQES